ISHRGGSAEPEALRSNLDALVEQARKAHQAPGTPHILLEQLNHIGPARDVFGRRVVAPSLSAQRERGVEVARTFESEGMHDITPSEWNAWRTPHPEWPRRCGRKRRSGRDCRSSSRGSP